MGGPEPELEILIDGGEVVLAVVGALDERTSEALEEAATSVLDAGAAVLVDLGRAGPTDERTLQAIAAIVRHAGDGAGSVALRGPCRTTRAYLRIWHLDRDIAIRP